MRVVRTLIVLVAAWLAAASPALSQTDFTGQWAPLYQEDTIERVPGPELGDYTGLPLTEAARLRADSWDADRISVVQEYQCRPHSADYRLRGLAPIRIWADYDHGTQRIVAFHVHLGAYENKRTVYLDGRPHPPDYAAHTFQGFSTGVWEGNTLTITTTHLKANYLRRNGVPRSAKARLTEHWNIHGTYLTIDERARGSGGADRAARAQPDVVPGPRAASGPVSLRVRAGSARAAWNRAASPARRQP